MRNRFGVLPGTTLSESFGSVTGLRVTSVHHTDWVEIVVSGDADTTTSGALQTQIVAALPGADRPATIDLSRLTFCDLSGMDALEGAISVAEARGTAVTVRGESELLAWMRETFAPRSAARKD